MGTITDEWRQDGEWSTIWRNPGNQHNHFGRRDIQPNRLGGTGPRGQADRGSDVLQSHAAQCRDLPGHRGAPDATRSHAPGYRPDPHRHRAGQFHGLADRGDHGQGHAPGPAACGSSRWTRWMWSPPTCPMLPRPGNRDGRAAADSPARQDRRPVRRQTGPVLRQHLRPRPAGCGAAQKPRARKLPATRSRPPRAGCGGRSTPTP